jgi:hypothetical protein
MSIHVSRMAPKRGICDDQLKLKVVVEYLAGITSLPRPGYSQAIAKLSSPPPSFMRAYQKRMEFELTYWAEIQEMNET